ncbi:MAG: hypothetical protein H7Y11_06650 [Armatimonadetes bacterium]|nr:hypothetical protein [Anaerolineae bacterium]
MLLNYLRLRYTKARMVAYLHGELPPAARRRVARYIDRYPACYAEYAKQRDAVRELSFRLPLVGQAETPDFTRMWSAIQTQLASDSAPRRQHPRMGMVSRLQLQYGAVGLVLALVLLLPVTFSGTRGALTVSAAQPVPATATAEANTPSAEGELVTVLVKTTQVRVTPPPPAQPRATAVSTDE